MSSQASSSIGDQGPSGQHPHHASHMHTNPPYVPVSVPFDEHKQLRHRYSYSSLDGADVTGVQHPGALDQQFPPGPVMPPDHRQYVSYSSPDGSMNRFSGHPHHALHMHLNPPYLPASVPPVKYDGHLLGVTGAQHRGALDGTPVSHVQDLQQFPPGPDHHQYVSYSSIAHLQGPYGQHPPYFAASAPPLNLEHNNGHLLDSYSSLHDADVNRGTLDKTHVQQPGPVMTPGHPQYIAHSSLDGALDMDWASHVQNPA